MDDPDDVYVERIAEMALEMDQAFEYMKEVGTYLQDKEDIEILGNCNEMTEQVIDQHLDLIADLNDMMLKENDEADKQMNEMLEL